MNLKTLSVLAIVATFTLTAWGGEKESAKVLDETGSNLDYVNGKAAKLCADKADSSDSRCNGWSERLTLRLSHGGQ
jgi:hypothetical protein